MRYSAKDVRLRQSALEKLAVLAAKDSAKGGATDLSRLQKKCQILPPEANGAPSKKDTGRVPMVGFEKLMWLSKELI